MPGGAAGASNPVEGVSHSRVGSTPAAFRQFTKPLPFKAGALAFAQPNGAQPLRDIHRKRYVQTDIWRTMVAVSFPHVRSYSRAACNH